MDEVAPRIAYAKLMNAGQTCIAPDYVLAPQDRVEALAGKIWGAMQQMWGTDPANPDYTSIAAEHHYARLKSLVDDATARGAPPDRHISAASPRPGRAGWDGSSAPRGTPGSCAW